MKTKLVVGGFHFESAHNLLNYDGKCKDLHGHSYKLEVTVSGMVNDDGFLMDFGKVKEIVNREVVNVYDHKYLNGILSFNPTAEFLAQRIAHILHKAFAKEDVSLVAIKLWETENNAVIVEL